jgi:hypothetical protein
MPFDCSSREEAAVVSVDHRAEQQRGVESSLESLDERVACSEHLCRAGPAESGDTSLAVSANGRPGGRKVPASTAADPRLDSARARAGLTGGSVELPEPLRSGQRSSPVPS